MRLLSRSAAAAPSPDPAGAAAAPRRRWVFRAPSVASCWLRSDLEEVVVDDLQTAFLLHVIYRGAGIHYTCERTTA